MFVGIVDNFEGFITKCEAQISINNVMYRTVTIEGEWMTERFSCSHNKRAISTIESIDITPEIVDLKECKIKAFL